MGSEILRERFDGTEVDPAHQAEGRETGTRGWTDPVSAFEKATPKAVKRPISLAGARKGAVSFDLRRKPGENPSDRRTVFSFVGGPDAARGATFFLQVQWGSDHDPKIPMIHLRGTGFYENGFGLWNPWIVLDREVPPGAWVHIDLLWDDDAKRYELLVDGRRQDVSPNRYFDPEKGVVPDPRTIVIEEANRAGAPPGFRSLEFSEIVKGVREVYLGVHANPRDPSRAYTPLSNAVISNFAVYAGGWPPAYSGAAAIKSLTDDSFKVPGISGKLVAGDKVSVELVASPGGKASFDAGRAKGIPMEEAPAREAAPGSPAVVPGTYRGSYTIRPGDDWENGQIVGRFASADNVVADPAVSASKWTIETKPQVTFSIDRKDLPADSSAKARIKLKAKDANGNPLKGRRLKLTLATTDHYTGTVGAGDFGKQVGGSLETRWRGETDAFGEVEFDYTAGFAAKTVILTAKDLDSGGVAVDYITAYKEASIDIALKKVVSRAAVRRSTQYVLKVEASRSELTADGRSRSVIRATLTDPNGTTVPGDPVAFSLSTPNGTLRTIQGTTDASGVATAEYVAGKKIGIVVVTATATFRNVQGQVSITLLADAPAKIFLAARPDNLPADGFSRSDIQVKVTDINDNPNRDTKVEFKVARGGGKVEFPDRITDRFGEAANRYTAGTEAGIATILATVRSAVPTEAELAKARNVLFVPYNPEGEEVRVERWLKKKGDAFARGEPLVEYTVGRQKAVNSLPAPFDGTMKEILVEYWDKAEVGQSLAVLEPAKK
jgi:biotin carboxyl carrier protein